MENRFEQIKAALSIHNQQHLLKYWGELSDSQQTGLLEQIGKIDLDRIDGWIEKYVVQESAVEIPEQLQPPEYYPANANTAALEQKYAQAKTLGEELIANGKVAAFVVAGGQGTRLGFDGPKGNFPIAPVTGKTLFTIFADQIKVAGQKYSQKLPWYIMTSPLNDRPTREIFEEADYFGLDKNDIFIFRQGTLPNFSFDGKILLAAKDKIAVSPDGHGGSLKALWDSGAIKDMAERGIEQISYFQVDNPLINIFDPLFIGLHASDGAQMSSKALIKAEPFEKIGNFCSANGRIQVIEYSDMPEELALQKNDDGSLRYELGSIAIHMIERAFVEELNRDGFALEIHRAVKKIPHIDAKGNPIKPEKPNGVKLETFVFDALPLAEKSIIFETIRSEEFAPTKNATGVDSAESARQMMIDRAAAWLEDAGVNVPRKNDKTPDCTIEMAASFALHKEDVAKRIADVPNIEPGAKIELR